jgi:hypothetical protein
MADGETAADDFDQPIDDGLFGASLGCQQAKTRN